MSRSLVLALPFVVFMAASAGCSPQSTPCDGHCIDAAHADGADGSRVDTGHDISEPRSIVSVSVTPADQILRPTIAMPVMVAYHATGTLSDGSMTALAGTWSLADTTLGSIDPVSGVFTANAVIGGTTMVQFTTAASGGGSGQTSVTVMLSDTIIPTPAPTPGPDVLFLAALGPVTDTTAQANIVYPLDHVVFPQNITAPLVQWEIGDASGSGGATDWYQIVYTKPHITVTQYVQNGAGFQFAASTPDLVFSRLAETDPSVAATVAVNRLDVAMNRVVGGTPIHVNFAHGSVSGTVYYWAMDEGRLHRVPAGTVTNDPLFPSIVGTPATDPTYSYASCIACHQISRDGRYLAANGDYSYVFDLTSIDPTMPNAPANVRPPFRWYFSTISPDDTRIFATMGDTTFGYTDLLVNNITPTGTVPTTGVAHPSWSPDGHTVAFISNVVGWTSNAAFTGGDLTIVTADSSTDTFSDMHVIHTGSTLETADPAGGDADCFPSWTPDSRFLVFDHTPQTRGTGARAPGSLFMMPPTTGAAPVRLAIASDDAEGPHTHFPNLSPFISGGYYWIVFYSTRDYGNALAGTAGTQTPQLWVSALSTSFDGTTDPSSVPYWLPGQSTAHQNADAEWAASPCRMTGDSCVTSTDCCTGACTPAGDGGFACVPPPMCRREGESCETTSDCCGGGMLTCDPVIHTCQMPLG